MTLPDRGASRRDSQLGMLLRSVIGTARTDDLFDILEIHPALLGPGQQDNGPVARVILAQALTMILFDRLIAAVPEGRAYCAEKRAAGLPVLFDHGAVRTVDGPQTGALPRGYAAISRILEPLGFVEAASYPLSKLHMTGRAFCHSDAPEHVAQFFVSELHVEKFSPVFQKAVAHILASAVDPLSGGAQYLLSKMRHKGVLDFGDASKLLSVLARCFGVHHAVPDLADYETLLNESAEMAWIATEGNVFNHATDRITDLETLTRTQRAKGRQMKDQIEVSAHGTVRQTAFRASRVVRRFRDRDGYLVERTVPGSFFEFIHRETICEDATGSLRLDLRFDSGNAQGIFKMTAQKRAA